MPHPATWLRVTEAGLYCDPGDFHIDPTRAVPRAVITHGHSDHARPDHGAVLATAETLAIMRARMGDDRAGAAQQAMAPGEGVMRNGVGIRLVPAGHVLGSAQVVLDWQGSRAVISGDYKRRPDPTCAPFEPVACDVFVTEATFALPVFRHPPVEQEVAKLLESLRLFPDRAHVIGVYSLGKCQRLIALLRRAGWERPIYLHGALMALCALYEELGVALGPLLPVPLSKRGAPPTLAGEVVLAPPSAETTPWARRLAEPVVCAASGWMRVRQRAKARGIELPLIISDHADWDELLATCAEVEAPEVWVTHGREDALIHALSLRDVRGRALHLVGLGEEDEGEAAPVETAPA
ncbi:ligase-associated DNA damage response exonuclease [Roseomonas hellenica]|uniref:Ligase-associated DNA damage response exonuclease n=1 Tax=Plastoroseomonas hellenica TaxID=2687306 RepID=A0ABS5EZQ4_9PROT|nr:ligase-associated DNA damage response exonuclease [Plastoroseomonas hellenica]MBR0665788.1 ligase-associated DNA damage response exonuclease [Plastoroseomonas hellenica]